MFIVICLSVVSSLDVKMDSFKILENDMIPALLTPDSSSSSECHPINALYYGSGLSTSTLTFTSDTPTTIALSILSSITDLSLTLDSSNSASASFTLDGTSKDIKILYTCVGSGWAEVTLSITYSGKSHEMSWFKYCGATSDFDWSLVILMLIAIVIVGISAYLARNVSFLQPHLTENSDILTTSHAIGFVVVGSLFLVLLFFFMKFLGIVLEILISLGGVASIISVIQEFKPERYWGTNVTLPIFGTIPAVSIVVCLFSVGFVLCYVFTKNWMLSNVIGLCFAFTMIKSIKIPSFKVGGLLLGLAFFYDIFWVYFSSYVFGDNVMVAVAQGLDLPIKLQFPHFVPDALPSSCSMLGLGDLALPGLFLAFASRFDHINRTKYLNVLMGCYGLALAMCVAVLLIFKYPQPALLYISPMLIFGMLGYAYFRGEVDKIWRGITATPLLNYEFPLEEFISSK